MRPTVERYQYNLWGVLKIKSHGELNLEGLEVLKREWAGQAYDGWGECFSQEGIECESDCDLYVYFDHSKFRVQTEQKLKGVIPEQELTGMEGLGGTSQKEGKEPADSCETRNLKEEVREIDAL